MASSAQQGLVLLSLVLLVAAEGERSFLVAGSSRLCCTSNSVVQLKLKPSELNLRFCASLNFGINRGRLHKRLTLLISLSLPGGQ